MNGTYEESRRWVDKIAFFGLFIAALLIARLIVHWKSAVVLSEPIELDCAALSVCMPTGNGWRSEKQWKYQGSDFTLGSFFAPGHGSVTALVSCRYLLAATKDAADVLFEEKASAVGGSKIVKTGQIEIGSPDFSFAKDSQKGGTPIVDWAYIKKTETLFDTFFGIVQLPNNRRLDIEVYQTTEDTDLAEDVFKSVIGSLKFTDNRLLEAGSRIVAEIKGKGLDNLFAFASNEQEEGRESFFLVKDVSGSTIGFTMEVLDSRFTPVPVVPQAQAGSPALERAPEAQLDIQVGSFHYIRGRQQVTFFQSDNSVNEFVWKSEASGPSGRSGTEIILGRDGVMTVKKSGRRAKKENYQISPAAIPDILGEFIFSQMLDSDQKEIFVDIIDTDGKITPVFVSRVEMSSPFASQSQSGGADFTEEKAAYVFRVELLNGRGFSEQVYLDDQRRILRRLLQRESTYTIERATMESVLREFPEQGSYILRERDKMLERDRPQESSGW